MRNINIGARVLVEIAENCRMEGKVVNINFASKQRLERHMAQIQITDLPPVIKPEQITFTEDHDE